MESSFDNNQPDFVLDINYNSIYTNFPECDMVAEDSPFNNLLMTISGQDLNESQTELASLDNFTDYFNCFICYEKVREPHMCPCCSKFGCETCLKTWLIEKKEECPFCRTLLHADQLIKCRFLKDFSKIIDALKLQQLRNFTLYEKNEDIDKCEEHCLKMIYYCTDCDNVICPDCFMFTKKHTNHNIERVKSIYEKQIEDINKQMFGIKKKITLYEKYLVDISRKTDQLDNSKEKKAKQLILLSRALHSKLESDIGIRLQSIVDERRRVEDELAYLETVYSETASNLKALTPARLIEKWDSYLKDLKRVNQKNFVPSIPRTLIIDFEKEIGLKYATGTFIVKPYTVSKEGEDVIYSDPITADGITWRIKIYPNGTAHNRSKYLALFVEMVSGWKNGGTYCYKVVLVKSGKETENIEREYISEFENSICWGYNRFVRLDDIMTNGFWDAVNDQITIRFLIKPTDHFQKINDQNNYIKNLEEKLDKVKTVVKKFTCNKKDAKNDKKVSINRKSSLNVKTKSNNSESKGFRVASTKSAENLFNNDRFNFKNIKSDLYEKMAMTNFLYGKNVRKLCIQKTNTEYDDTNEIESNMRSLRDDNHLNKSLIYDDQSEVYISDRDYYSNNIQEHFNN